MSKNLEEIENEALKLSIGERATLAESLVLSLDAPSEVENLQLWVHEAERRLKELRTGAASDVPIDEVFRRATAAIS